MRWTPLLSTLALAAVLTTPALAQQERDGAKDHGETKRAHMEMRMHASMSGTMAAHAERLGLTDDQVDRLEALEARLEAEKERHHAEMKAIHEAGMEILTPEQRDRMKAMMREMHAERGHEMNGHDKGRKHQKKAEERDGKKDADHDHDHSED